MSYRQTLMLDRIAELEAALKPFADYARALDARDPGDPEAVCIADDAPIGVYPGRRNWEGAPTLGDCRRALAATTGG